VLLSSENEPKLMLLEVYRDSAAFETHRAGSSIAQWRRETVGLEPKLSITKCEIVD